MQAEQGCGAWHDTGPGPKVPFSERLRGRWAMDPVSDMRGAASFAFSLAFARTMYCTRYKHLCPEVYMYMYCKIPQGLAGGGLARLGLFLYIKQGTT